jgi:hypothetical protein
VEFRKHVAEREALFRDRHQVDQFLGTLESRPISDPKHLNETAKQMAEFLDDEHLATPIEDLCTTLAAQRTDDFSNLNQALLAGVTRYYIRVIWKTLQREAREHKEIGTRMQDRFLDNVTLANLHTQGLFKEHFHRSTIEYRLVALVVSNVEKRKRLRPLESHDASLDPGLTWIANESSRQQRVDRMLEQTKNLEHDLRTRVVPDDELYRRFDPQRLVTLAEELTSAWSVDVSSLRGSDFMLRKMIKEEVQSRAKSLLADIRTVPKEQFVNRLKLQPAPPAAQTIDHLIGPAMLWEMLITISADLHSAHETYEETVAPVRDQRAPLQESLLRLDNRWKSVLTAIDNEKRRAVDPTDFRLTPYALFETNRTKESAATIAVSVHHAMNTLFRQLKAATRPPSAIASLTLGYDWRAQVLKAAQEAEESLDWLHSSTEEWIDSEMRAQDEAEAKLVVVRQQWSDRVNEIAAAQKLVIDEMSIVHQAWTSTGRRHRVSDLFQLHVSQLECVPDKDCIRRAWVQDILDQWDDVTCDCWQEAEVEMYNRVRKRHTVFVSWADLQKCVLMRQTELVVGHL